MSEVARCDVHFSGRGHGGSLQVGHIKYLVSLCVSSLSPLDPVDFEILRV